MTDAALSLTASLASLLTKSAPTDPTATGASATSADPFAALFAAVTGGQTTSLTAATTLAAPPPPPPAVPTTDALALALPVPTETALPAATDKADADDTKDESDDPLGDAIAAGATAVLALAPAMVAPMIAPPVAVAATTVPTPIAIDGPISPKLPGSGLPRAAAFKSVREARVDPSETANVTSAPATAAPIQTVALPINGQAQPDKKTNDDGEQQAPAQQPPEAKPATAALSPETLKAVAAALNQSAASTATPDTAAAAATIAPVVEAKARTDEQTHATQVGPQQAVAPAPVRRPTEEAPEPRRVGSDTRKRSHAADIAPLGLAQRLAETARPASGGDVAAAVQDKGDTVVQQTLSIAKDGAWLDSLTRDIVASAGSGNDLNFTLEPQNLGSLTVAISQGEDGASIRMTADTDTTRNLLLDAQPKLIAEARAQGLKVSDTQVDLKNQQQGSGQDASRWAQGGAGQNGTAQNGQNRQSSPAHQPFVSNLGRTSNAESESPSGDSDALYA